MKPTLYDILGVRPDATPQEIKRAWRDSADRFEPGSGSSGAQFRLFNEAAEVLLDPARRREYDEQLGVDQPTPAVESSSKAASPSEAASRSEVEPPSEVEPETVASRPPQEPPVETEKQRPAEPRPGRGPVTLTKEAPAAEPSGAAAATPVPETTAAERSDRPGRAAPPTWVTVALGVLALVLVVVVAWLGLRTWDIREARHLDQATEAGRTAPAVAERAAAVILSYDYRSLGSDEKASERYMTPRYAKTYANTFRLVQANAPKLRAHVTAQVRASGVTTADPDRVNVLLFVDQTTVSTANDGQKQSALNRVEMKMVRQNGTWLVDDITSY